jgi:hypothetical protein
MQERAISRKRRKEKNEEPNARAENRKRRKKTRLDHFFTPRSLFLAFDCSEYDTEETKNSWNRRNRVRVSSP